MALALNMTRNASKSTKLGENPGKTLVEVLCGPKCASSWVKIDEKPAKTPSIAPSSVENRRKVPVRPHFGVKTSKKQLPTRKSTVLRPRSLLYPHWLARGGGKS